MTWERLQLSTDTDNYSVGDSLPGELTLHVSLPSTRISAIAKIRCPPNYLNRQNFWQNPGWSILLTLDVRSQ